MKAPAPRHHENGQSNIVELRQLEETLKLEFARLTKEGFNVETVIKDPIPILLTKKDGKPIQRPRLIPKDPAFRHENNQAMNDHEVAERYLESLCLQYGYDNVRVMPLSEALAKVNNEMPSPDLQVYLVRRKQVSDSA